MTTIQKKYYSSEKQALKAKKDFLINQRQETIKEMVEMPKDMKTFYMNIVNSLNIRIEEITEKLLNL